jgi:hypothetical protein
MGRRAPRLALWTVAYCVGAGLAWGQTPAPDTPIPPAPETMTESGSGSMKALPPVAPRPDSPVPASAPPVALPPGSGEFLYVSRNLFLRADPETLRSEVDLAEGGTKALGPERMRTGPAQRLRIVSPDSKVRTALQYRPRRAGSGDTEKRNVESRSSSSRAESSTSGWTLTVIVLARQRPHDYLYLANGQEVREGRLEPQRDYALGKGMESDLVLPGGRVEELILQDEGDAELRLTRKGEVLELAVIPPRFGGEPSGASWPWFRGEPLRFVDYQLLAGGYAKAVFDNDYLSWLLPTSTPEHGYLEGWLGEVVGLHAAAFTLKREQFSLERLVVTQQALRGETWSVWVEGGAAAAQRTLTPTAGTTTQKSTTAATAGLAGHLRFNDFGAALHWADTGGPSYLQALLGWQATRHVGLVISWISYRSASPFSLGISFGL